MTISTTAVRLLTRQHPKRLLRSALFLSILAILLCSCTTIGFSERGTPGAADSIAATADTRSNAELYRTAMDAYRGQRFEEAIEVFLHIDSAYQPLYVQYWLAKSYEKSGNNLVATTHYEKALAVPSGWHDYHGYIFYSLSDLYNL